MPEETTQHEPVITIAGEVYLTRRQVAARLLRSPRTLEIWERDNYLMPTLRLGATSLYKLSDLENWVAQRSRKVA
jgi:hypothetical protein